MHKNDVKRKMAASGMLIVGHATSTFAGMTTNFNPLSAYPKYLKMGKICRYS